MASMMDDGGATATGLFAQMLDERLKNWGLRLDGGAIDLLEAREQAFMERLAREGRPGFAPGDPDIGRSLDRVVVELVSQKTPDQEMVGMIEIQRIIEFFCPGLPPIC